MSLDGLSPWHWIASLIYTSTDEQPIIVRPQHPYFPPEAQIHGWAPNELPVPQLLAVFAAAVTLLLSTTVALARQVNARLTAGDLAVTCWFMLCGCLHLFFEGYFVLNHAQLASQQTLPAQLWKEYALSDSRYLTQDPLVLCMESLTVAILGPLSLLTACLTIMSSPYRHAAQIVVSAGHIYSDALYYATAYLDLLRRGVSHSRPEALYFWGYYVFLNSFWIVVPSLLIYRAANAIASRSAALERLEASLRRGTAQLRSEELNAALKAKGETKEKTLHVNGKPRREL